MKSLVPVFFLVLVAGCGPKPPEALVPGDNVSSKGTDMKAPADDTKSGREPVGDANTEKVTVEQIGLPAYPGATVVKYSGLTMKDDMTESFNLSFESSDTPAQVAEFYRPEVAKYGKLYDVPDQGDKLKTVGTRTDDGVAYTVQAMSVADGKTRISLHKAISLKK